MKDFIHLPPHVAIFGSGPSLKVDLINWTTVPPFRIALNAAAWAGIPGLCAVSAMDREALDDFGGLPKHLLVIHSVDAYQGKFGYELFFRPMPLLFTTANLLYGISQYGVNVVHMIGFDSLTWGNEEFDKNMAEGHFYSEDVTKLGLEWQARSDANPYKTIRDQIIQAFGHTRMVCVSRHMDPDLYDLAKVKELADEERLQIEAKGEALAEFVEALPRLKQDEFVELQPTKRIEDPLERLPKAARTPPAQLKDESNPIDVLPTASKNVDLRDVRAVERLKQESVTTGDARPGLYTQGLAVDKLEGLPRAVKTSNPQPTQLIAESIKRIVAGTSDVHERLEGVRLFTEK